MFLFVDSTFSAYRVYVARDPTPHDSSSRFSSATAGAMLLASSEACRANIRREPPCVGNFWTSNMTSACAARTFSIVVNEK